MTTSSTVHANNDFIKTSYTSTIAGSVTSVLVATLLAILVLILYRKKKTFGKTHSFMFLNDYLLTKKKLLMFYLKFKLLQKILRYKCKT